MPTAPPLPLSLRLSPAAIASLDARPEGRTAALAAAVEAIGRGEAPAGIVSRRTEISARLNPVAVSQARATLANRAPAVSLAVAIEALLLSE